MPGKTTSESIKSLGYSVIREMSGMAADYENVISLGIGEPDFNTPAVITKQAFEDAKKGHTHYTHSQGDPELLEKLSVHIFNETGFRVPPHSIIVTHGGMGALTAALKPLLEPGDEVLLMEPHFPDYMAHITFAGGVAKKVPTFFEDGFVPRPENIEKAITEKTKLLLLNSPNNPTGAVIPGDVLDGIAEIVQKRDIFVISDEVYDKIIFGRTFESIYTRKGMDERTLVAKSFSKSHAMTGWRVGYCYGPEWIIAQMLKVVNYSTACASSIGQRAAIAALDIDRSVVNAMRDRFAARVDLVCRRLEKMKGIRVVKPCGAFYVFADISLISQESRRFAIDLLKKQQVVVIPGYAFGDSGEGCIRIACTVKRALLEKAMDRLETFISGYHGE